MVQIRNRIFDAGKKGGRSKAARTQLKKYWKTSYYFVESIWVGARELISQKLVCGS